MQLFSRRVHLVGAPHETMPYAIGMREFVSDSIGREVALWSAGFGAPVGTLMYTMRVAGVADLADATGGLNSSATALMPWLIVCPDRKMRLINSKASGS